MGLVRLERCQLGLKVGLLRLELGLLGVQARKLAPLGGDPGHEDDDRDDQSADAR